MNFDAWEVEVHPTEDFLMHWGIKGMKHGRRRYQTESGEWTELGLEERRKREGFGESKAERKLRKKVEKAERHQARKAAKAERKFNRAEAKRKKSLKGLTDEEMRAKLERAKMEAEYRDLTKKGSLVESGAKLVGKYLDYKDKKEQRTIEINRQKIDKLRAEADIIRAKEGTKRARAEADKAKEERKTKRADVIGGLRKERKRNLIDAKKQYKEYTVRGGIGKRINMMLTSGKKKQYEKIREAQGDVEANKIRSDSKNSLRELQNKQDYRYEKIKTRRDQKLNKFKSKHK